MIVRSDFSMNRNKIMYNSFDSILLLNLNIFSFKGHRCSAKRDRPFKKISRVTNDYSVH